MNRREILMDVTALPLPPDMLKAETRPLVGLALLKHVSVLSPAFRAVLAGHHGGELPPALAKSYAVSRRLPA